MRRRGFLAGGTAFGLGISPALAATIPKGLAFVLNSGSASVSVIDVSTRTEVRRVPVLREPHHMALTPDRRSLLVGDTVGNELLFLDPVTATLQRRMPMPDPYQLVFSPDGAWLTVAGLARNQIDIYAADSLRLVHRLPARAMPSHINYAPDSSAVYVSLQQTDSLIAIAVKTGEVVWTAKVGLTPAGVLWHGGNLLVGIMGEDYVAVVDPANGRVTRRVHTDRGAHVMFNAPDGTLLYVSNRVAGSMTVLDARSLELVRSFALSGGPDDLDFAPDGSMWISRRWAHSVAVVDPRTGHFTTIATGRSPHGIWLNTHDTLAPVAHANAQR